MQPTVTIHLERYNELLDTEEQLKDLPTVSLKREFTGLLYGNPYFETNLTFYDPTKAQKALVKTIEDLEYRVQELNRDKSAMANQLSSTKSALKLAIRKLERSREVPTEGFINHLKRFFKEWK